MDGLLKLVELFLSPKRNGFPVLIALVGLAFAYFGYDLFRMGVQEGGAALNVSFGADRTFEMGKGGPGLIFVAFGMGLIIYAIRKFDKLRVQPDREVGIDEDGRTYEND
jgi:hypothetical protein